MAKYPASTCCDRHRNPPAHPAGRVPVQRSGTGSNTASEWPALPRVVVASAECDPGGRRIAGVDHYRGIAFASRLRRHRRHPGRCRSLLLGRTRSLKPVRVLDIDGLTGAVGVGELHRDPSRRTTFETIHHAIHRQCRPSPVPAYRPCPATMTPHRHGDTSPPGWLGSQRPHSKRPEGAAAARIIGYRQC